MANGGEVQWQVGYIPRCCSFRIEKQSVVNIVMRSGIMVMVVVKTIQIQKENVLVFLMDHHGRLRRQKIGCKET